MTSSAQTIQPKRALGIFSLIAYGLAYIAPITVLATYGLASVASGGRLVLAYALATVTMLLTALSFGSLAAEFPVSGSVYVYASKTMHPTVGLIAAWALLLDYLLIPVINLILIGVYGSSLVPAVPAAAWIVGLLVLTTALNLRGITTTDRASIAILAIELACLAIFAIVALVRSPVPALDVRPPATTTALLNAAGLLSLSFLGFDAVTSLADEAKNPRRDIPIAVIFACFVAGVFFCSICWIAYRAYPAVSFDNPDVAAFTMAEAIGGKSLAMVIAIGLLVGALASTLASQAAAARLLFGLSLQTGRFEWLSRLHPTRHTPDAATLLVTLIALSAFAISLDDAVSFVSFGALVSFLIVNVCVVVHRIRHRQGWWRGSFAMALLGIVTTGALCWGSSIRAKVVGAAWLVLGIAVSRRPRTPNTEPS